MRETLSKKLTHLKRQVTWLILFHTLRIWSEKYMDQFELVQFKDRKYGHDIYVKISYYSDYPQAYEKVD